MIKNILVPIPGLPGDATALEIGYLIARLFDACITCLHVRPDAAQLATRATAEDFGTGMIAADLFDALREQDESRTAAARAAFDSLCAGRDLRRPADRLKTHRVTCEWREGVGDDIDETIKEGRFYDVLVLPRAADPAAFSPAAIGRILTTCGRPLVVAPMEKPENLAPTIAIAWKETPEAARAVTAAMPLLEKADRIYVLSADEGDTMTAMESAERLARQLRRHERSAEARCVVPGDHAIPEAVLEAAVDVGADMLVMGAYGHSRSREFVFGGFTRHVLNAGRLPVFLSH